jgi:ABC-type antimicrobial peptide transport system permease subunit
MIGDVVDDNVRVPQLAGILLSIAALTTLFLAVVGVYTAVREAVHLRMREMGLRKALGARQEDVLLLVLGKGLRPIAGGVVLGLAGALITGRVMAAHLFAVNPASPLTLLAGVSILVAAATFGCLDPAFTASRVDPIRVIKAE